MKKLLALVLALCMMAGMTSAMAEGFTLAESYDVGERVFDGGEITTVKAGAGTGSQVSTDTYAGIEGKDYTDEKVYTYHDYTAALTSSTRCPGKPMMTARSWTICPPASIPSS